MTDRRIRRLLYLAVLAWTLSPCALLAQRQPVLQQIKLPHNYYYREMYVPQVTSGPNAVTWSTDGKSLIYSMQGSLWRQRLGDTTAEQLTTGPGYDYQPDWSPDGKLVVYASYHDDAIELRTLDVNTLESRSLLSDGAVNLEPRWSPDGRRLAWVSTAFQGRWHIYTADVQARKLEHVERITEDKDSGLPRYYYSVYDHYISPTWSPDGRELIVVSNRTHVWGSGGFWRLEAKAGSTPREIHYEETTWQARPDWARDGKRVVYSGYQGRQWHQLWLMTSEGENPFQLTFGEFDATCPRWSPDGTRIAYISNEGGNTSLWVVTVPGGARQRVEARQRTYREPVGRLRVMVFDAQSRKPLAARISLTLPDGRAVAPDDAWRHADDGFVRGERKYEVGYFHSAGSSTVTAPAGPLRVEVVHGGEYRVVRRTITIKPDTLQTLRVTMDRIANQGAQGWTSGDLHVHMNYAGHYRATPATLAFQARAEGLNLVENLIVNKEGRMPDIGYFTGKPDSISRPDLLIAHDQEFHTSYWGHSGLLGLTNHLVLPGYAAYANTAAASPYPDNGRVADEGHAQGALFGYVHPFDVYPDPNDTTVALSNALPVDVGTGKVDYYEVVGFSDHLASARVWYQLLNCGFRIPAGAGTDAMTNFASLRGPLGTDRVYVESGVPLDHRRWLAALRAGKSFATNGPLLEFSIGGQGIGSEIVLPSGGKQLNFKGSVRSIVPIDHFEIVGNGKVIASLPVSGDRTRADFTIPVTVDRSGWYTLRAWAEKPAEPILDIYPFASTSPIYVTVGGVAVRSPADAEYFLKWLDRVEQSVSASTAWNSEAERREVLGHIQAAREEFERRLTP